MDINQLLQTTLDMDASDFHLSTGQPPIVRVDGELQRLDHPVLSEEDITTLLSQIMDKDQLDYFHEHKDIDFAYALGDIARFRANVFGQQRGISAAFRPIPANIPTLDQLGFPEIFRSLCEARNGLVLVTGPTGSGKSTSLAAMIDHINRHYSKHIITIEDPVEFTHSCQSCLINQRELNADTKSFNAALRAALREDPDILLVGEMRDLETIQLALRAAETGHLVFATLHTNSAAQTIDRIIDVFPPESKLLIRTMLADSLRGVISQTLLKKPDGGRVAALEIMICTPAIRNLIRENKIPQIYSAMQTGTSSGMCTLEQHLEQLVNSNILQSDFIENMTPHGH